MTQKALLLEGPAKPLVYTSDHLIPQPGELQVQVKVAVAGLNGHDQKIRDMGMFLSKIGVPAVLANDVVGTVTALGSGVTSLKKGDRVLSQADFAHGTPQNGLQEYAILNEQFIAKIPDSITDDDAATLPTNVIASLVALFHGLPIPAPWTKDAETFDYSITTLLIIGGGSVAGRYAIQLANLAGLGRIVVVGGNEDELKAHGATHVIDRHGGQAVTLERIRLVVGDDLIYAFDAVNMPEGQLLALNALSSHTKGFLTRLRPLPVDSSKVLGRMAGFEVRNVLGVSSGRPALCRAFWKRLPAYLETGQLVPWKKVYAIVLGLNTANVNAILDGFKEGGTLKHAHVHL